MATYRNVLFGGALAALIFTVLRAIQDGPNGETSTGIGVLATAVLFGFGVIRDGQDRARRPPKNE